MRLRQRHRDRMSAKRARDAFAAGRPIDEIERERRADGWRPFHELSPDEQRPDSRRRRRQEHLAAWASLLAFWAALALLVAACVALAFAPGWVTALIVGLVVGLLVGVLYARHRMRA
jgi:hypothetical protein